MKVPLVIIAVFLGAILAMQGWVAQQVISLKEDVATLKAQVGFVVK